MKAKTKATLRAKINLAWMRLMIAICRVTTATLCLCAVTAAADDQRHQRRESHNYIIERQQAGAVSGVPTSRRIIGRREIDIYRDGSMYERNSYIGNAKGGGR